MRSNLREAQMTTDHAPTFSDMIERSARAAKLDAEMQELSQKAAESEERVEKFRAELLTPIHARMDEIRREMEGFFTDFESLKSRYRPSERHQVPKVFISHSRKRPASDRLSIAAGIAIGTAFDEGGKPDMAFQRGKEAAQMFQLKHNAEHPEDPVEITEEVIQAITAKVNKKYGLKAEKPSRRA